MLLNRDNAEVCNKPHIKIIVGPEQKEKNAKHQKLKCPKKENEQSDISLKMD
jgi:hypothetical protein